MAEVHCLALQLMATAEAMVGREVGYEMGSMANGQHCVTLGCRDRSHLHDELIIYDGRVVETARLLDPPCHAPANG